MNDSKIYYWLSLSGASNKRLNAALDIFSPEEIWSELPNSATMREAFGERGASALLRFRNENFIDAEISKIKELGINIVTRATDKFPARLLHKEVCPPVLLYYKGDLSLVKTDCVAIVGTRACSKYGQEVAATLSRGLAENGVTVVSGLATGVDGFAHKECVKAGGKTIAVLGSGLNKVYPASNIRLSEEIEYSGLLLSEYPPDLSPTKYTFPERNRLISGLSLGVVVVEAALKSGALITADFALEQGREVFAVPGNITSQRSAGANKLIADGAKLVSSVEDILSELKLKSIKKEKTDVLALDFSEQKLYTLLCDGDKTLEELVQLSGFSPAEVNFTITSMEIKGIIFRIANTYGVR